MLQSICCSQATCLHQVSQQCLLRFSSCTFQGSHILNLLALTLTVESAFDSVQNLMREKEEKLMRTKEKFEREKLKFDMRRLSRLQPMTGAGFLTISKSTLTSMLSVRQKILNNKQYSSLIISPASRTSLFSSSSSFLCHLLCLLLPVYRRQSESLV